jgi:hypothetical protein
MCSQPPAGKTSWRPKGSSIFQRDVGSALKQGLELPTIFMRRRSFCSERRVFLTAEWHVTLANLSKHF